MQHRGAGWKNAAEVAAFRGSAEKKMEVLLHADLSVAVRGPNPTLLVHAYKFGSSTVGWYNGGD